ncbi:MAG TPA: CAP domain-containing protein [Candidatus Limnocylindrales bacterium]|nr:CAP domain-containing protein [Candidatus Limnocylindrales bacterium]
MERRRRVRPLLFVGIMAALALGVALRPGSPAPQDERGAASPSLPPSLLTAGPTAPPASPGDPPSNDAAAMLRVHNELRARIGAPALGADERVTAAAQRHAEYLARHGIVGHEETPGEAGFTGASVRDRLAAQGYEAAIASEVATSFGTGTDGVRSLWVLPYHRLGLMHPQAVVAGWGHADVAGRTATVGVLVYDFGAPAPERVRSPASGERVPGSWSGEEFPDVLPAGAARPVGYPIMVVYSGARAVELRAARLTDASGRELAHHVVPQLYEPDYVAIVPAIPLAPSARYRVQLELTVAGSDVVEEWEFETEP